MPPSIDQLRYDLNRLYQTDTNQYSEYLNMIKGLGYKVFRNDEGNHKIQIDISTAFGGVFNNVFNRG